MLLEGQVLEGKAISTFDESFYVAADGKIPRLIALMLGRLGLSIDEAIRLYVEFPIPFLQEIKSEEMANSAQEYWRKKSEKS